MIVILCLTEWCLAFDQHLHPLEVVITEGHSPKQLTTPCSTICSVWPSSEDSRLCTQSQRRLFITNTAGEAVDCRCSNPIFEAPHPQTQINKTPCRVTTCNGYLPGWLIWVGVRHTSLLNSLVFLVSPVRAFTTTSMPMVHLPISPRSIISLRAGILVSVVHRFVQLFREDTKPRILSILMPAILTLAWRTKVFWEIISVLAELILDFCLNKALVHSCKVLTWECAHNSNLICFLI